MGDTCIAIIVIIMIAWFSMRFLKEVFGVAPGQMYLATRKPPKYKEIELMVHPRLIRQWVRMAKDSWDHKSKVVWVKSLHKSFYATSERNMIKIGKIRGYGCYEHMHLVVYRAPWRLKKMILLAPPDILLSSSGSKNLVYEGTGVIATGYNDVEFFSPSRLSKWTVDQMRTWVKEIYEDAIQDVSGILLSSINEDLKARAVSPSAIDRRRIELGRGLSERSEVGDIERPTTETSETQSV